MKNLVIYLISDSVGETARSVMQAALSQFDLEEQYEVRRFPYVVENADMKDILTSAESENALVIYTLAGKELQELTKNFCQSHQLSFVDLLSPLLEMIAEKTQQEPLYEAGALHKLNKNYFKRMDAIEFAVKYDDGKDARGLLEADIILLGISRTSKTPLSIYLGNKNIKVANLPLVPEVPLPKEVFEIDSHKLVGLTNSLEKLNHIRLERLRAMGLSENANYANFDRICEELEYSNRVMRRLGCPVIDVSNKAIEETAGIILNIKKENDQKILK